MAVWDGIIPESDLKIFGKGGYGGTSTYGGKPALVVVDMTRAFVDERYHQGSVTGPAAVEAIRQLLGVARARKIPVVYTTGAPDLHPTDDGRWKGNHSMLQSAEAHEICPEIAPYPEDLVIAKRRPSIFFGTDLIGRLVSLDVDTLVIICMTTSGCVRASVVDTFSYSYCVITLEECVADRGQLSHKVSLFDMHMKYADMLPLTEVEKYLAKL
jgi:nicotinamidase-related amidase